MSPRFLASVLAGALLLIACAGEDVTSSTSSQDVVVKMFDNRFEYTHIAVPLGGTVKWVGAGRQPHNAVAADGSWTTEAAFGSLDQLEGDESVLTYDQPGTYVFFCTYHGNAEGDGMAGTLVVGGG